MSSSSCVLRMQRMAGDGLSWLYPGWGVLQEHPKEWSEAKATDSPLTSLPHIQLLLIPFSCLAQWNMLFTVNVSSWLNIHALATESFSFHPFCEQKMNENKLSRRCFHGCNCGSDIGPGCTLERGRLSYLFKELRLMWGTRWQHFPKSKHSKAGPGGQVSPTQLQVPAHTQCDTQGQGGKTGARAYGRQSLIKLESCWLSVINTITPPSLH